MTGLRTAVGLLRAMVYPELSFRHHCLTTSSRVVCVSLEDSPSTLRLIGSTLPSCGSAASRFSVEGRVPCYRVRETSLRLRSTSECDPGYPHLNWCTLSRGFLPLQRNPTDSSHRSRAFHARVMLRPFAYHAIRRFAPESISPVSLNRVRSWGSVPFRA
jgi:hypothetical protein